ncbi:MAG: PP2C family serine/threonine-protein phosphatase [Eubacterium sp.]
MAYRKIKIYSYKTQGDYHKKTGKDCQDVIKIKIVKENEKTIRRILSLSDGAGSAKYGGIGARENAEAVTGYFEKMSLKEFLQLPEKRQKREILNACQKAINKQSILKKCTDKHQFSATLLLVVIEKNKILVAHLGDGYIAMSDQSGNNLTFQSEPDNGSAANVTYFTVSHNAVEHLRLSVIDTGKIDVSSLVMTSDGLCTMLSNRGYGKMESTVKELLTLFLSGKAQTKEDLKIILNEMTELPHEENNDDRSIILMTLCPHEELQKGKQIRNISFFHFITKKVRRKKDDKTIGRKD